MSTLWVILCHLPEKGRKEIEEIVEEMKDRDREKRGKVWSYETEVSHTGKKPISYMQRWEKFFFSYLYFSINTSFVGAC